MAQLGSNKSQIIYSNVDKDLFISTFFFLIANMVAFLNELATTIGPGCRSVALKNYLKLLELGELDALSFPLRA